MSILVILVYTGEKTNTVEVRGSEWMDGKVVGSEEKGVEFTLDTEVKLARYNAIRYTRIIFIP